MVCPWQLCHDLIPSGLKEWGHPTSAKYGAGEKQIIQGNNFSNAPGDYCFCWLPASLPHAYIPQSHVFHGSLQLLWLLPRTRGLMLTWWHMSALGFSRRGRRKRRESHLDPLCQPVPGAKELWCVFCVYPTVNLLNCIKLFLGEYEYLSINLSIAQSINR